MFGGSLDENDIFRKIVSIGYEFETHDIAKFSLHENGYSLINFIEISETEYNLEKLNNEINIKIKLFNEKRDIRLKLVKSIIQEMKDQLDDNGLKEIKDLQKNNHSQYHTQSLNQNL